MMNEFVLKDSHSLDHAIHAIKAVPLDGSKRVTILNADDSVSAFHRRKYRAYLKEIAEFETEQNRLKAEAKQSHSPHDYDHFIPDQIHEQLKKSFWKNIFIRDQATPTQKIWTANYNQILDLTVSLPIDERNKALNYVVQMISSEWATDRQYADAIQQIVTRWNGRGLYLTMGKT